MQRHCPSRRGVHQVTAAILTAIPYAPQPLHAILDDVSQRLQRGQRLADALAAFQDAIGPGAAGFVDGLATADRYGLPIHAIGVGEGMEDLRPFDAGEAARAIAGVRE